MLKKVLILSSSPRQDGNSELLCKEFLRGAKEAGHEAKLVSLREKKMNYCLACDTCRKNGGICVHQDDVPHLLDQLLACDVFVLASPVYYYDFSAQMKTLIDRTYAVTSAIKDKEAYLLMSGASPRREDMRVLEASYHGFLACFKNVTDKGILYGTGAGGKGEINSGSLLAAYQMGKAV